MIHYLEMALGISGVILVRGKLETRALHMLQDDMRVTSLEGEESLVGRRRIQDEVHAFGDISLESLLGWP